MIFQINFTQMIGYLFLGPETLFDRDTISDTASQPMHFGFRRIIPKPLRREDFFLPLYLLKDYRILLAAVSLAVTFNFILVMMTVEIPIFFPKLFHLKPQQVGINFLGFLVG